MAAYRWLLAEGHEASRLVVAGDSAGGGLTVAMLVALRDAGTPLPAPLHANLTGLPPLLIQVGTAEVLYDDATCLAARARAAGVVVTLDPWADMIHDWQLFADVLPEAQEAIARLGEFARTKST